MKQFYRNPLYSFIIGIIINFIIAAVCCTVLFVNRHFITGSVAAVLIVFMFASVFISETIRRRKFNKCIGMIVSGGEHEHNINIIDTFPVPMAIVQADATLIWHNKEFSSVFEDIPVMVPINKVITELDWSGVLKSTNGIKTDVHYLGKHFEVLGDIVNSDDNFNIFLYFIDRTFQEKIQAQYENERLDIALVSIDNYDEIMQRMDDYERQSIITKVDSYIRKWGLESAGVMRRFERDRYILVFEHQFLSRYIEKKFDVIDFVREVGENVKQPITISIGIGTGGTLAENDEYARAAIDMVLSRGGDQAAIKDDSQYKFFGGKSKEYEKSTRVRTRAMALALKDYIKQADNVIIMGHINTDFDALGAAVGLQRAVRNLGKTPYIIYDGSESCRDMVARMNEIEEYDGMVIDSFEAQEVAVQNTLVIIVDVHRPSMVTCPSLLNKSLKIVLIDHHRRSTEFINNCSLVYHEPYASSTCEMATELLQYIDDGRKMTTFEATALYMGLVLDTKNFVMKTGVRTFDSASYLRRYGVDTMYVKSMFSIRQSDYINKAEIVKKSKFINDSMVVSVCEDKIPNIFVVSSQAADDMLGIIGVKASFVVYPIENGVGISGRSLGAVNVQLILEKLGGGGHMMVAGAQIRGISLNEAKEKLADAVKEYISETAES
ncbi:MAG: DHH family phosphoesterase [Oscillospiraceae bacterium]|nr:DHH family phosphoesterase [Oscillospiraceae bacterium]